MDKYTIKELAEANECESADMYGLACVWNYWLECNCNDMQCVNDFTRLYNDDMEKMMEFLQAEFPKLANYIGRKIVWYIQHKLD